VAETRSFAVFVWPICSTSARSLTGRIRKDVLELPILGTICLLSSSVTVALATRALARVASREPARVCSSPLCSAWRSCQHAQDGIG